MKDPGEGRCLKHASREGESLTIRGRGAVVLVYQAFLPMTPRTRTVGATTAKANDQNRYDGYQGVVALALTGQNRIVPRQGERTAVNAPNESLLPSGGSFAPHVRGSRFCLHRREPSPGVGIRTPARITGTGQVRTGSLGAAGSSACRGEKRIPCS